MIRQKKRGEKEEDWKSAIKHLSPQREKKEERGGTFSPLFPRELRMEGEYSTNRERTLCQNHCSATVQLT